MSGEIDVSASLTTQANRANPGLEKGRILLALAGYEAAMEIEMEKDDAVKKVLAIKLAANIINGLEV